MFALGKAQVQVLRAESRLKGCGWDIGADVVGSLGERELGDVAWGQSPLLLGLGVAYRARAWRSWHIGSRKNSQAGGT